MKKNKVWMLAAIMICGVGIILSACKGGKQSADEASDKAAEYKKIVRSWYGVNKTITDDSYDKSLAVKCINGTFVGKLSDSTIVFRGIPYVGKQPVGSLRWKAPVGAAPATASMRPITMPKVPVSPRSKCLLSITRTRTACT